MRRLDRTHQEISLAHILDAKGDVVVKVRFEPPSGRWKTTAIGKVLAMEIKRILEVER